MAFFPSLSNAQSPHLYPKLTRPMFLICISPNSIEESLPWHFPHYCRRRSTLPPAGRESIAALGSCATPRGCGMSRFGGGYGNLNNFPTTASSVDEWLDAIKMVCPILGGFP